MSLNVGGLYVEARRGVTRDKVIAAITEFWKEIGARPHAGDALAISPLSLDKTGILGFAVAIAAEGPSKTKWIAVYDSERYRADPALARQLAIDLDTCVVHYEMAGATDQAYVRAYGEGAPELPKKKWDDVEEFVAATFPYSFLYFNKLSEAPKDELADFAVFAFEGIPARPKAQYTGPSTKVLGEEAEKAEAERLAKSFDIDGLKALRKRAPHVKSVIRDAVKYAKQTDKRALAFVLAFTDDTATDPWTNREVAEAAVRAGDDALFEKAFASSRNETSFALFEACAFALYQEGNVDGAIKIYGAVIERPNASLTAWNNWLAMMLQRPLPAQKKLASLLARAAELGAKNPSIFHNLACLHAKWGDLEAALEDVKHAVHYGYENLDKLRADEDLAPLRDDARFAEAFVGGGVLDLAELEQSLIIYGKERVVMRPVLGMFFFFKTPLPKLGPCVADLLERYLADIPAGSLTHYKHGHFKALGKAKLTKDKNALRKIAKGYEYVDLAYRGGDGDPTDYTFDAELRAEDASSIALTFPRTIAPEDAFDNFRAYAALVPFEAGSAGYTILERDDCNVYEGVHWDAAPIYARCLGFEKHPGRQYAPGTPCGAHWLTLVSDALLKKLGAGFEKSIGEAKLERITGGALIRAAAVPPIALATKPDDVGALPDVARALQPFRRKPKFDTEKAYERFARVASSPWKNV